MKCIWEHNGNDTLLYSADYIGAYTRGASLAIALRKMQDELRSYALWRGQEPPQDADLTIVQEQTSSLHIADADSDVLFDAETVPLSPEEYAELKALALKSALDFQVLYSSIPDPDESCLPKRNTFYGSVPRTAREMYEHTKNVNAYYFAEIEVDADNTGDILNCRRRGFEALERKADFLENATYEGSYGEDWSLRKVLRRFIWHDRIHAKAMYRMAVKMFGMENAANPFCFNIL